MKIRYRNLYSWVFLRPWLGVPLGIWVAVSVVYYWWLISRINVLESQNIAYRTRLKWSVDSSTTYKVPEIPDAIGTLCETIHIAIVCMGQCNQHITPMLKSLLHHRQNPLHFHMIVDSSSEKTINTLFNTWDLPDVNYTCYNALGRLEQVRWIPNSHYSGIFGLVKLLFPDILPESLDKVVILDSDLTFLCDIAELWALFSNMTDEQVIGIVENESNWYLVRMPNRWPALGRGYNTGVMLLDLRKMRNDIGWTVMWHEAVVNNLEQYKQVRLADQDIINVIIKSNPQLVYNISCQYNVQLSTKSLAKNCYGEDANNVKIVHWNTPHKYTAHGTDGEYFKNIHQSYVNFDGDLLRDKLHKCGNTPPATKQNNSSSDDVCYTFRAAQSTKFRTHLYFMEYSYENVDNFDVTLVIQLSTDRIQFLERLVKYWEGPLSAAIYLSDCEVGKLETFIKYWSDTLSSRRNIGYHLVFKRDSVHYPVNYLRNVALENVNTPYVFLMDVDFVPMAGLYDHLRDAIRLVNPAAQKLGLVVPAFETLAYRAWVPRVKAALLRRLDRDVAPFRAREWPAGHRATHYTRWRNATKPYEVEWQLDYEPYLVIHRTIPKYDTRFSGYGWNKVSHMVELRVQGYRVVVLPAAFVVHTPHTPSQDIAAFRAHSGYRVCLKILKKEFLIDLEVKYNTTYKEEIEKYKLELEESQKKEKKNLK